MVPIPFGQIQLRVFRTVVLSLNAGNREPTKLLKLASFCRTLVTEQTFPVLWALSRARYCDPEGALDVLTLIYIYVNADY